MRWMMVVFAAMLLPWRVAARVDASPSITVVSPENHLVLPVDPATGVLGDFALELSIHGFHVPDDGIVHVTGEKIGEHTDGFVISVPSPFITISGVEPGTHFWRFALIQVNGSTVTHTTFHMDAVVPQHTALPQWRYTLDQHERHRRVLFNLPHRRLDRKTLSTVTHPSRHRICFVGSTSGFFDGQKKIYLQAIAALPRPQWDIQVITFEEVVESSAFSLALQRLNVTVQGIPLLVRRSDLEAHEIDPSEMMTRIIKAFSSEFSDKGDFSVSIDEFRQRIASLHPPFASKIWQRMVNTLHDSCAGAVLVFASSTDESCRLLVDAARVAGVKAIVMELANLQPLSFRVDALVGPSHYALNHPSITKAVETRQRYVLSTGIDTELFRPVDGNVDGTSKRFTIGYIGRLATEKTVGLFIRAARLIAMSCRAKCRFRVIGDGPQRQFLEKLAEEWGIIDFVEFPGGIYEEHALVEAIQQLDVVLSLCFHETLGIAPLEAMSCGVPVVGFSSGGVGEFLEHGVNGLAVESATAEGIRDSIMTLVKNESLRQQLGSSARRTVVQRFSYQFGAQQYVTLYERLARH